MFCDRLKGKTEVAKTVIHESMHRRLGSKGTKDEEIECFIEEFFHDHKDLTEADKQSIIKTVDELYVDRRPS